jgi:hypothetical protein
MVTQGFVTKQPEANRGPVRPPGKAPCALEQERLVLGG